MRSTRRLLLAVLSLALALVPAASAQAGPLVDSVGPCEARTLEQPFLRWLDPARYFLVEGGGFESGSSGWDFNGAARAAGNETFYVHSSGDRWSLSLPAGSSATSPSTCVGIGEPTLRLFARNSGSALSTLKVEVLYEDAAGNVRSLAIGLVSGGASWQPTLPLAVTANLLALLPGDNTPVAFRFTPQGANGEWRIDDVYVDPWRGR
ncbi:MAG: hypothetical protein M3141_05885 [Actinomycetota bacterium]|nr:hypothetical protein [Actinomycetota bacterium]